MIPVKVSWAIPHLCGLPASRRYSRLLLMFRSFIDDTEAGSNKSKGVFCFAGWVSSVEEWERFSDAWGKELSRKPSIAYFRHYESNSQTGQFSGWTKQKSGEKTLALARVIAKSQLRYGVLTGIRTDVVRNFMTSAVPSIKTVRSILHVSRPYDWAFHSVLAMVLQSQVNYAETEKVDFVFDEGDAAFEDCSKMYRRFRDHLPPAIRAIAGTVTTGDDKTTMPLQASDLLAGVSTARLRGKPIGEAYKLLQSNKLILFSPITRRDNPYTDISGIISLLNIVWSIKMIEKAGGKK